MGEIDIEDPFIEIVEDSYASLNPNMTKVLRSTLSEDLYIEFMEDLKEKYQFNRFKDCRKNFILMKEFLDKCYETDIRIPILEEIVQKIYDL